MEVGRSGLAPAFEPPTERQQQFLQSLQQLHMQQQQPISKAACEQRSVPRSLDQAFAVAFEFLPSEETRIGFTRRHELLLFSVTGADGGDAGAGLAVQERSRDQLPVIRLTDEQMVQLPVDEVRRNLKTGFHHHTLDSCPPQLLQRRKHDLLMRLMTDPEKQFAWLKWCEVGDQPIVGTDAEFSAMLRLSCPEGSGALHFWNDARGFLVCRVAASGHGEGPRAARGSGGGGKGRAGSANSNFKENAGRLMLLNLRRRLTFPDVAAGAVDESDRVFKVSSLALGDEHRLFMLSEVQATDAATGGDVSILLPSWQQVFAPTGLPAQCMARMCAADLLLAPSKTVVAWTEPYSNNLKALLVASGSAERLLKQELGKGNDGRAWDAHKATHVMHRFLTHVKRLMRERAPGQVVTFRYNRLLSNVLQPRFESQADSLRIIGTD